MKWKNFYFYTYAWLATLSILHGGCTDPPNKPGHLENDESETENETATETQLSSADTASEHVNTAELYTDTSDNERSDSDSATDEATDSSSHDSDTVTNLDTMGATDSESAGPFATDTAESSSANQDSDVDAGVVDLNGFISADGEINYMPFVNEDDEHIHYIDDGIRRWERQGRYRIPDICHLYQTGETLLHLSRHRGLQVVDIQDLQHPQIIGRYRLGGGTPVQIHVIDTIIYIMVNEVREYGIGDAPPLITENSMLLALDLTDLTQPTQTERLYLPGVVQTSQLVTDGVSNALYLAATSWTDQEETVLNSYTLGQGGSILESASLSLGDDVQNIHVSGDTLVVSRVDPDDVDLLSQLAFIDISDASGQMVEGGAITLTGQIWNDSNIGLHNNIMKVVSTSGPYGSTVNHFETVDISDIEEPIQIDHLIFGDGEDVLLTLFFDNLAFVTISRDGDYDQVFHINGDGTIDAIETYTNPDWNPHVTSVFDGAHLLGWSPLSFTGWTPRLSLYDLSVFATSDPLIVRQDMGEIALTDVNPTRSHGWDDWYPITVMENAVSTTSSNGTEETGLVLLPYNYYDDAKDQYTTVVQMVTFSPSTLTQRGILGHNSRVEQSLKPGDGTVAVLSERYLSLHDITEINSPNKLSQVPLIPNYSDFEIFGDYGVRVWDYYDQTYYQSDEVNPFSPNAQLQVISLEQDGDTAVPLATIDVLSDGPLHKVGDDIAVTTRRFHGEDDYETTLIDIIDMSSPTTPVRLAQLENSDLDLYGGLDPGNLTYANNNHRLEIPTGNALLVPNATSQREIIGEEQGCRFSGELSHGNCYISGQYVPGCTFRTGWITCTRLLTETEATCEGKPEECTVLSDSTLECVPLDMDMDSFELSCDEPDNISRRWTTYTISILDLRDPANPVWQESVVLPEDEGVVAGRLSGSKLYINYKRYQPVPGDNRAYAKYYYKAIDFSDPAAPVISDSINVPGVLVAIDGDTIYTRDPVYRDDPVSQEKEIDLTVNRLSIQNGEAHLEATLRFDNRIVRSVMLDERGYILVNHRVPWNDGEPEIIERLSIYEAQGAMAEVGGCDVPDSATLKWIGKGKALFSIQDDAVYLVDISKPASPFPEMFVPLDDEWPRRITATENRLYLPAADFGLYNLELF